MDPVPDGQKTCKSGSPTLVRTVTVSTFVAYTCGSTAGYNCSRPNGVLHPQALLPLLATVVVHSQLINQAGLIFTTGCGAAQTVERRLVVRQARVRIPSRHPFKDPSTERQQWWIKSGPQRLRFMLNIVRLSWNINKSKRVTCSHQTLIFTTPGTVRRDPCSLYPDPNPRFIWLLDPDILIHNSGSMPQKILR